jgi:hypothetical protein
MNSEVGSAKVVKMKPIWHNNQNEKEIDSRPSPQERLAPSPLFD